MMDEYPPHQLEGDAEVVAEVEVVEHVDDVVVAILVPASQVVQDLHFHQRLLVESLLVPGDTGQKCTYYRRR